MIIKNNNTEANLYRTSYKYLKENANLITKPLVEHTRCRQLGRRLKDSVPSFLSQAGPVKTPVFLNYPPYVIKDYKMGGTLAEGVIRVAECLVPGTTGINIVIPGKIDITILKNLSQWYISNYIITIAETES